MVSLWAKTSHKGIKTESEIQVAKAILMSQVHVGGYFGPMKATAWK